MENEKKFKTYEEKPVPKPFAEKPVVKEAPVAASQKPPIKGVREVFESEGNPDSVVPVVKEAAKVVVEKPGITEDAKEQLRLAKLTDAERERFRVLTFRKFSSLSEEEVADFLKLQAKGK